jgi:hypothetical protein
VEGVLSSFFLSFFLSFQGTGDVLLDMDSSSVGKLQGVKEGGGCILLLAGGYQHCFSC